MSATYDFTDCGIIIRHSGWLTAVGTVRRIRDALCDYNHSHISYIISDFTKVSDIDTSGFDSGEFVRMAMDVFSNMDKKDGGVRWGIISAGYDVDLFMGIAAKQPHRGDFELKVFASIDEALPWATQAISPGPMD